jgi:methyltransferase (TIGR00027 family)
VVFASGEPALAGILPPEAAELSRVLLGATSQGRKLLRWIDSRAGRVALRLFDRCTVPGIIGHWVCRKRWIEDVWQAARREGFDTLVVLGSGFDTLSWRVARGAGPSVRTIDLDHPATLVARRAGIAAAGGPSPLLVEYDLCNKGLDHTLNFDLLGQSSTFVLIEGVLMYFDSGRIIELFAEIAALPALRLRVVFTFMEISHDGRTAFRPSNPLVDLWLKWRGEPFCSGFDCESLEPWLSQRGFSLSGIAQRPGHSYARGVRLPSGECGAVAEATGC